MSGLGPITATALVAPFSAQPLAQAGHSPQACGYSGTDRHGGHVSLGHISKRAATLLRRQVVNAGQTMLTRTRYP
ncbi:transposase fragment, IS1111 [Cupriavidus taiwanensis]|nr:transposase fragment, IS1111 [Cupriavidus taiwanensis]SOZ40529.1 transposase fragment, IS1111 [Cupriavidus neocaledonicus]SOY75272.1 transposase fragment, IS1111 [Cupriavidus taiwanensis]SOY75294.1 transposase fragment, IS1111 [Cupriavidus taiwanensis]SOY75892.1 transposase fragment, IS1111 [Cupriavidus taiwanensis]